MDLAELPGAGLARFSYPGRQVGAMLRERASESYLELSRTAERIGRSLIGELPISTATMTGVQDSLDQRWCCGRSSWL